MKEKCKENRQKRTSWAKAMLKKGKLNDFVVHLSKVFSN